MVFFGLSKYKKMNVLSHFVKNRNVYERVGKIITHVTNQYTDQILKYPGDTIIIICFSSLIGFGCTFRTGTFDPAIKAIGIFFISILIITLYLLIKRKYLRKNV